MDKREELKRGIADCEKVIKATKELFKSLSSKAAEDDSSSSTMLNMLSMAVNMTIQSAIEMGNFKLALYKLERGADVSDKIGKIVTDAMQG